MAFNYSVPVRQCLHLRTTTIPTFSPRTIALKFILSLKFVFHSGTTVADMSKGMLKDEMASALLQDIIKIIIICDCLYTILK